MLMAQYFDRHLLKKKRKKKKELLHMLKLVVDTVIGISRLSVAEKEEC